MAQIEQSDKGGKKKKGAQKKMSIHVDFTPMVDMNMLLITFFMLCTTMIKSQTLQIVLPTNEDVKKENQNQAKASEAITMKDDPQHLLLRRCCRYYFLDEQVSYQGAVYRQSEPSASGHS